MNQDEYSDLVDENDNIIGRELRSVIYANGWNNIRGSNGFIKNSKGQLWIPRRTKNKRIFPGALDMSAGGHVDSGEDYEEAFIRETMEELNLDLNKIPFRCLGYLRPQDGFGFFQKVYEIPSDEVPHYNPHDFSEYYWITPEELLERIEAGDTHKSDLPKLIRYFYL